MSLARSEYIGDMADEENADDAPETGEGNAPREVIYQTSPELEAIRAQFADHPYHPLIDLLYTTLSGDDATGNKTFNLPSGTLSSPGIFLEGQKSYVELTLGSMYSLPFEMESTFVALHPEDALHKANEILSVSVDMLKILEAETPLKEAEIEHVKQRIQRHALNVDALQRQTRGFKPDELSSINQAFSPDLERLQAQHEKLLGQALETLPNLDRYIHLFKILLVQAQQSARTRVESARPPDYVLESLAREKVIPFKKVRQTFIGVKPVRRMSERQSPIRPGFKLVPQSDYEELSPDEYEKALTAEKMALEEFIEMPSDTPTPEDRRKALIELCKKVLDDTVSAQAELSGSVDSLYVLDKSEQHEHYDLAHHQNKKKDAAQYISDKGLGKRAGIHFQYVQDPSITYKKFSEIVPVDEHGNRLEIVRIDKLDQGIESGHEATRYLIDAFFALRNEIFSEGNATLLLQSILTVRFNEVITQVLDVLQNSPSNEVATKAAMNKIVRLVSPLIREPQNIYREYLLPTEITNDNFLDTAETAAFLSLIERTPEYYMLRADWSPPHSEHKISRASCAQEKLFAGGIDGFDLSSRESGALHNYSKEEMKEQEQKVVFELEMLAGAKKPKFITVFSHPRKGVQEEPTPYEVHDWVEPDYIIRSKQLAYIDAISPTIPLPLPVGTSPVEVHLAMPIVQTNGKIENPQAEVLKVEQTHEFSLKKPEGLASDRGFGIEIMAATQIEDAEENELGAMELGRHKGRLAELADELGQVGMSQLSERVHQLSQYPNPTIEDVRGAVQASCVYSYDKQTYVFNIEEPLRGLASFVNEKTGKINTQCRGANELLAYCLSELFRRDGNAAVFVDSGYAVQTKNVDRTIQINQAQAHAITKFVYRGKYVYLDATPFEEVVSDLEYSVVSVSTAQNIEGDGSTRQLSPEFVRMRQEVITFLKEKGLDRHQITAALGSIDRGLPINSLMGIFTMMTQPEATVGQILEELQALEENIDSQVTQPTKALEKRFELYDFTKHLDVYNQLKETIEKIRKELEKRV